MSTNVYADVKNLTAKLNGLKLNAAIAERDGDTGGCAFWLRRAQGAAAELADARERLAAIDGGVAQ